LRREFLVGDGLRSKWRRAIGWIAVYALALQTIVGGIDLIQNAASAAAFDPSAIICHGHGTDDGGAAQTPAGTGHRQACGHCALCALLAAPVPAPTAAVRITIERTPAVLLAPSARPASTADIASNPGKPRAPPATV